MGIFGKGISEEKERGVTTVLSMRHYRTFRNTNRQLSSFARN